MATKQGMSLGSHIPPEQRPPGTWEQGYRDTRVALLNVLQGRINATGEVELVDGDSPLTVLDDRCTENTIVIIMITTSDLANNFVWWISAVNNGSFVFEFTFSGQLPTTTVRYALIG